MVLHTIVPEEIVFQGQQEELSGSQEIEFKGKKVLVQPLDFKRFRVVQIISSDPTDFLDSELQPGAVVTLSM